jgi:hypothetical protein
VDPPESVVVCAPVVVVPAAVVPDAIAPAIELLIVLKYHEYPVGATVRLAGAVQLNDQLDNPEIVRLTPVAGSGIPYAVVFETARLAVEFVVFEA